MKSKRRILVIENSIDVTGALKSVCRTAFDLRDRHEFVFILPKGSRGREWIEAKGFKNVYELPFVELSKRIGKLVAYLPYLFINAWRVAKIIRKEQIDLVHINDLYNLVYPVARIFGANVPYICHVRFLPDKFPKKLFSFWFKVQDRYAEQIVAVSKYLFDRLPSSSKVSVVYNELPVENRYPQGLPKYEHPVILYLSNVIQGKGHEYIIEVFSRISSRYPEWRLRFVGGDMGMEKNRRWGDELKRRAQEKKIADKIEWIGFSEEVEREYRKAEIALNFSDSESFSITCLEALYFGCPIVATKSGGPSEIIDHSVSGFLVPKGDLDAMEHYLCRLLDDPTLRQQFSAAGMRIVRERFSVANTSFKLNSIYEKGFKTAS